MKKGDFYIRRKMGFYRVTGYIDTITDRQGQSYLVGFHRANIGYKMTWGGTHIATGALIAHGATRKECLEDAKSDRTLNMLSEAIKSPEIQKAIEEMNQFLKTGAID